MLATVSTPPPPRDDESPATLRTEIDLLRAKLQLSERARLDLLEQAEHLLEVIAWSRREIQELQRQRAT